MRLASVVRKSEQYDVYIGRPSKWGNPFVLRSGASDEERTRCIERYREWLMQQPELLAQLHELRGKRLACFCKPKACHGDILAELANRMEIHNG
jgi:hypothetical protein